MPWVILIICCIVIILTSVILFLYFSYKNEKCKTLVKEHSQRIHNQIELNKNYIFYDLQSDYLFVKRCSSKRKLDTLNMNELCMDTIEEQISWFKNTVNHITSNVSKYNKYMKAIKSISSTVTEEFCQSNKISLEKFIEVESKIFNKNILCPITNPYFTIKAIYTSPKGRNNYERKVSYSYSKIIEMIDLTDIRILDRETRQSQIKSERAKMTDSLRYDILKRDNFRCQICGSTASDGVKLHVDHIVPVSKGGKTVKSNLRTLCDRCNLGKGAKTEQE